MKIYCPACKKVFSLEVPPETKEVKCRECSAAIPVPEGPLAPGAVIGDFLLERALSSGGMGQVYLARQLSLDRPVALKVLHEKFAGNKEYIDGLFREARAAAKLTHPNIVQAYAVGEENGIYYFAMEYIKGETFKQILKREKILDFDQAVKVIKEICGALDAAWNEQKLVHQDIKPDNIMLSGNGFAKLADLGLARSANSDSGVSDDDEVMGTPQYISPEQLTGVPTDVRSDIYSLGATFYQFVTGEFPYQGSAEEMARKHVEGNLTPPQTVNPKVPKQLNDIIVKMMARDITKRYQKPSDIIKDLDAYTESKKVSSVAVPKLSLKFSKKNKGLAGSAVPAPGTPSRPVPAPGTTTRTSPPGPLPPNTVTGMSRPVPFPKPAAGKTAEDEYEETEEPRRFRLPPINKKVLAIVLAAIPLLLIVLAVAFYFLAGSGNVPEKLREPGKKYVARINSLFGIKPAASRQIVKRPPRKKPRRAPVLPPKPAGPVTRKAFLAGVEKALSDFRSNPEKTAEFLAVSDGIMAEFLPAVTDEEKRSLASLKLAYAPLDEQLRALPARKKARAAVAARLEEKRKLLERQAQARREAEERRRREAAERERRLAEQRREQQRLQQLADERSAKLKQDLDLLYRGMTEGFCKAVSGGGKAELEQALARAGEFIVPAECNTPDDLKQAAEFREFCRRLPGALREFDAFHAQMARISPQFSIPIQIRRDVVNVISVIPGKEVKYRKIDGEEGVVNMKLPRLRAQVFRGIERQLKVRNFHFYYEFIEGNLSPLAVKELPNYFWKKFLNRFMPPVKGAAPPPFPAPPKPASRR